MAKMIPTSKSDCDFQADGEEKVFDLLKKLPNECLVFYEVLLGERDNRPDFMVILPDRGVVIVEVKDWGKDTVRRPARKEVEVLTHGGYYTKRKNPDWKCRVYLSEAKELMGTTDELLDEKEHLIVPMAYLVVMPNMTPEGLDESGLSQVMSHENVILKDAVASSRKFLDRILSILPALSSPLSERQLAAIRSRLRNDIVIDVPAQVKPAMSADLDRLPEDVFAIDLAQEVLAKGLGEGPRLMRGLAGTGKTLIMLLRAKMIASNAETKNKRLRVLVVCWNISLANYMRQVIDSLHGILLRDQSRVQVMYFMQFARNLARMHNLDFPNKDESDFQTKVTRLLSRIKLEANERYDAIYVDEGQDFEEEWIAFLFHKMLRGKDPKSKNFIVAADDAQRIYHSRDFSWARLDIPMVGRSRILRRIYRNSARVWGFAAFLFGSSLKAVYPDVDVKELEFAPKPGYDPMLVPCATLKDQIAKAVSVIQSRPEQYMLRNILILYRGAQIKGYAMIEDLIEQLTTAGIAHEWITEDNQTKGNFVWAKDCVKISTVHSAKGMDAPFVIVLGAETFVSKDANETKLMYVALTRAREYLMVLYSGDGGMVQPLLQCQTTFRQAKSLLVELENKAISHNGLSYVEAADEASALSTRR